jgi:hypothetical protein
MRVIFTLAYPVSNPTGSDGPTSSDALEGLFCQLAIGMETARAQPPDFAASRRRLVALDQSALLEVLDALKATEVMNASAKPARPSRLIIALALLVAGRLVVHRA